MSGHVSISGPLHAELKREAERLDVPMRAIVETAVNAAIDREESQPIVWGRVSSRTEWHRLEGIDHGPQDVRCRERLNIRDIYHLDTRDGFRTPVIGTACDVCARKGG